jgi:hypothetical protein
MSEGFRSLVMSASKLAPNPRLQRTPLRAPLSRKPLGRSTEDR